MVRFFEETLSPPEYYLADRESTRQDEVDREISSDYQVSELSIFPVTGLTTLPCI